MMVCYYSPKEKHSLCTNKKCIFNNWEEMKIKTKIENELKKTEELISEITNGEKIVGVTIKGLKHKRNVLLEEVSKYGN